MAKPLHCRYTPRFLFSSSRMPEIDNHLVISAIGPWRDKLASELLAAIRKRGCEVLDGRIIPLGDALSAQLLVAGNWSSIGKLETGIPKLAQALEVKIECLRTKDKIERPELRPFAVDINAPQQTDLLVHLLDFFAGQETVVAELVCQDYTADQTGARMVNIQLVVLVPVAQQPPALREAFMDLCDELHADGLLDPIKT